MSALLKQAPVDVAIKREGGLVVLKFSRDVNYLEVEPQNMIDMCEAMTTAAFEADTKLKPIGDTLKSSLVDKHRERLLPLLAHVIRSMLDQKKSPGQIAVACLDEMCKEVF